MRLPTLYMCALCRRKFRVGKIRYSKDGKRILCIDCYDHSSKKEFKKENTLSLKQKEKKKDIIKLVCLSCNYKFLYDKNSRINLICPYCGSKRLSKYEITAEKLIEETSNLQEENYYGNKTIKKLTKIN